MALTASLQKHSGMTRIRVQHIAYDLNKACTAGIKLNSSFKGFCIWNIRLTPLSIFPCMLCLINVFWLSCLCYSVTSSYYKNEAKSLSQMQTYFQNLLIPLILTYSWEGSLYCQSNRDALLQTNFNNLFIKIISIYTCTWRT